MIWRKIICSVLAALLVLTSVPVAEQDVTTTTPGLQLNLVETILYGAPKEGSLIPRIEQAERDVLGQVQIDGGSIIARIDNLLRVVGGIASGSSLLMRLNSLEWMTFQEVTYGQPLMRRIETLERAFYGEISRDSVSQRIARLSRDIWGSEQIHIARKQVPAETTLRISLLTEINSGSMKPGDAVRYKVTETLRLENTILIPAGTQGVGTVMEVRQAGPLGRDGLVTIDWGYVTAIDGTQVKVTIGAAATERNQHSAELAAGAAMAGVILLGPIGLAAGALVPGKEHVIPVGTQFYAEVAEAVNINGLSLVPVN